MTERQALLFVYNADSGLFNTMADIGHKIFSPETYSCDLCKLTHGYFTERAEWRAFIEQLDMECRFLHRDEFLKEFTDCKDALPAIFIQTGSSLSLCVDAGKLGQCEQLDELLSAVKKYCRVSA